MLDARMRRRHKLRNAAQGTLLFGGMLGILALLAWVVFGPVGILWVLLVGAFTLALRPRVPPSWQLSMYGAKPLPAAVAPQLHHIVDVLTDRAALVSAPEIHVVRSPMLNAFAVGRPAASALAVTDGLLRGLSSRELVGVLAHEVSHIRADDLWIMNLSDTVGRATHALAYAGALLLILALPATAERGPSPLLVALILVSAPTLVTLLQLALSRSREYDADLEAAVMTGDPVGLAAALVRLERSEGRIWERTMVPHRRTPDPLLLRTHPPTDERVHRLLELRPPTDHRPMGDGRPIPVSGRSRTEDSVRLRRPGIRW